MSYGRQGSRARTWMRSPRVRMNTPSLRGFSNGKHAALAPSGHGPHGFLRCSTRTRPAQGCIVVEESPRINSPDAVLYTDGSASAARGASGWGVYVSLHGVHPHPIGPSRHRFIESLGADRSTNNTSKMTAFYYKLTWVLVCCPHSTGYTEDQHHH